MPLDINIDDLNLQGGFQQDPFDTIAPIGPSFNLPEDPAANSGVSSQSIIIPKNLMADFNESSTTVLQKDLNRFDDEELKFDIFSPVEANENRYANARSWKQFRNGLLSRTLSIAPKVAQGFAHVGGAFGAIATQDINKIWNNAAVNALSGFDEQLRELFPVYASEEYANGSLWDKIWTDKFWFDDVFDGFAFAASAMIPGLAFSKLGSIGAVEKGVEAVKSSSLFNSIGKSTIGKFITETGKKVGLNGTTAAMTVYNTISEAGFEAYETNKTIYEQLLAKGYDQITAKEIAADAAKRTFTFNSLGLLLPNFIQSRWFFGGASDALIPTVKKALVEGTFDKAQYGLLKNVSKAIGLNILSEGFWEENFQTAIQIHEKDLLTSMKDTSLLNYTKDVLSGVLEGVGTVKALVGGKLTETDKERATAIILGGIIGTVMGGSGKIIENKNNLETINQIEGQFTDMKANAEKAFTSLQSNVNSIYKVVDGEVVLDLDAITKVMFARMADTSLFTSFFNKAMSNDVVGADLIKSQILSRYYYQVASSKFFEGSEDLINTIVKNNIQSMKPEDISNTDFMKMFGNIETELKSYQAAMKDAQESISIEMFAEDPYVALNTRELLYTNLAKRVRLGKLFEANANKPNVQEQIAKVIAETDDTIQNLKKDLKSNYISKNNQLIDRLVELESIVEDPEKTSEEVFAANLEKQKILFDNKHLKIQKGEDNNIVVQDSRLYDLSNEKDIVSGLTTIPYSKQDLQFLTGKNFILQSEVERINQDTKLTFQEKREQIKSLLESDVLRNKYNIIEKETEDEILKFVDNYDEDIRRRMHNTLSPTAVKIVETHYEDDFSGGTARAINGSPSTITRETRKQMEEDVRDFGDFLIGFKIEQNDQERTVSLEELKSLLDQQEVMEKPFVEEIKNSQIIRNTVTSKNHQQISNLNNNKKIIQDGDNVNDLFLFDAINLDLLENNFNVNDFFDRIFYETRFLNPAVDEIRKYQTSITENKSYDTAPKKISFILNQLKNLKTYLEKNPSDNEYLKSLPTRVDAAIEELEKAHKLALENQTKRDVLHTKFKEYDNLDYHEAIASFSTVDPSNNLTRADAYNFVSSLTPDKKAESLRVIESKLNALQTSAESKYGSNGEKLPYAIRSQSAIWESLFTSPENIIFNIAWIKPGVPELALSKMLEHTSLHMLLEDLKSSGSDTVTSLNVNNAEFSIPKDILIDVIENYLIPAKQLTLAKTIISNPSALKNYLLDVNENSDTALYGLNDSQHIMGFEVHRYFNTSMKTSTGEEIPAILQAPAGSGKSTSLQISLKKFLSKNKNATIVLSPSKKLQAQLAKDLQLPPSNLNLDRTLASSLSTDIKYVIIDEALGMNVTELGLLLNNFATKRPDVKILLIGDSTQTKDKNTSSSKNILGLRTNLHVIKGSSIPYRSDVYEITTTANLFKNKLTLLPSDKSEAVTRSAEITDVDAKGVFAPAASTELINPEIAKRLNTIDKNKEVLVVVDTEEKVKAYTTAYPDHKALFKKYDDPDIKGFTFKEVYLDIPYKSTQKDLNYTPLDYNDLMYTMTSRAQELLIVVDNENNFVNLDVNPSVSEGIVQNKERNTKEKLTLKERWPKLITDELEKLNVTPPIAEPVIVNTPDDGDPTQDDEKQTPTPPDPETEQNDNPDDDEIKVTETEREEETPEESIIIPNNDNDPNISIDDTITGFMENRQKLANSLRGNDDPDLQNLAGISNMAVKLQKQINELLENDPSQTNTIVDIVKRDDNSIDVVYKTESGEILIGKLPHDTNIDNIEAVIEITKMNNAIFDYNGFYEFTDVSNDQIEFKTGLLDRIHSVINKMYPGNKITKKEYIIPTSSSLKILNDRYNGIEFNATSVGRPYLILELTSSTNKKSYKKIRLDPKPVINKGRLEYLHTVNDVLQSLKSQFGDSAYSLNSKSFADIFKFLPLLTEYRIKGTFDSFDKDKLHVVPEKYKEALSYLINTFSAEQLSMFLNSYYRIVNNEVTEEQSQNKEFGNAPTYSGLADFYASLRLEEGAIAAILNKIREQASELPLTDSQRESFVYDVFYGDDLRTGFFLEKYFGKKVREKVSDDDPIRTKVRDLLESVKTISSQNNTYVYLRYGLNTSKNGISSGVNKRNVSTSNKIDERLNNERERLKNKLEKLEYNIPNTSGKIRLNKDGSFKEYGNYFDGVWNKISDDINFGSIKYDYEKVKQLYDTDIKLNALLNSKLSNDLVSLKEKLGGLKELQKAFEDFSFEQIGSTANLDIAIDGFLKQALQFNKLEGVEKAVKEINAKLAALRKDTSSTSSEFLGEDVEFENTLDHLFKGNTPIKSTKGNREFSFRNRVAVINNETGKISFHRKFSLRADEGAISSLIKDLIKSNRKTVIDGEQVNKPTDNLFFTKTYANKKRTVDLEIPKHFLFKDRSETVRINKLRLLRNTFNELVTIANNNDIESYLGYEYAFLQKDTKNSRQYKNHILFKKVKLDDQDVQELTMDGIEELFKKVNKYSQAQEVYENYKQKLEFLSSEEAMSNIDTIISEEQFANILSINDYNLALLNQIKNDPSSKRENKGKLVRIQLSRGDRFMGSTNAYDTDLQISPIATLNYLTAINEKYDVDLQSSSTALDLNKEVLEMFKKRLKENGVNPADEIDNILTNMFDTDLQNGIPEAFQIKVKKKEKTDPKEHCDFSGSKKNNDSKSTSTNSDDYNSNDTIGDDINGLFNI